MEFISLEKSITGFKGNIDQFFTAQFEGLVGICAKQDEKFIS